MAEVWLLEMSAPLRVIVSEMAFGVWQLNQEYLKENQQIMARPKKNKKAQQLAQQKAKSSQPKQQKNQNKGSKKGK